MQPDICLYARFKMEKGRILKILRKITDIPVLFLYANFQRVYLFIIVIIKTYRLMRVIVYYCQIWSLWFFTSCFPSFSRLRRRK